MDKKQNGKKYPPCKEDFRIKRDPIRKDKAMQMRPSVDFEGLISVGHGHLIEINPITEKRQYHLHSNDVAHVIDIMGGKQLAAAKLDVEEIEIEHWIDDHYVPTRYAEQIEKLTGWSIWSIQVSPGGGKVRKLYGIEAITVVTNVATIVYDSS